MSRPQPTRGTEATSRAADRSWRVCRVWVSAEGQSFVVLAPAWDEWVAGAFDETSEWRLCRQVGEDALELGVHEPERDLLWWMSPCSHREREH